MGTDIHVNILHRKKDNSFEDLRIYNKDGEDITWRCSFNDRNYILFGKLAGVRYCEEPLVPVRGLYWGLPQDVVDKYNDPDYCMYGASWYDFTELVAFKDSPRAIEEDEYEDGHIERWNPVRTWVERLEDYLELFGIYYPYPGEVIISIMFDC